MLIRPRLRLRPGDSVWKHAGIEVAYRPELDGGGAFLAPHFVEHVRREGRRFCEAFEWCAGPAFIGFALLAEGALAYIGLSVQPPDASLGSLLQQGFTFINNTPRLVLVPGVVIVLLSLSFNVVADGIRDALASRERLADVGAQA